MSGRTPTAARDMARPVVVRDRTMSADRVRVRVHRMPVAALAALDRRAHEADRSREVEAKRATEAWLDDPAAMPATSAEGVRVDLRLPRDLVATLDERFGVEPGRREGAIVAAVLAYLAEDSANRPASRK